MKVYRILLAGALTICTAAGDTNPPIADFVAFGLPGCHQHQQQAYTLRQTSDSVCYAFDPPFPTNIQSAFTTSIISGCVVYVYNDGNCTVNQQTLSKGVENCFDEPIGLGSYMVVCGRKYPTPRSTTEGVPPATACPK